MITHAEYMADSANLHHSYHLEIARECGIQYKNSEMLPKIIGALNAGDEHLNTIPLSLWDMRAALTQQTISKACKARGTFYSLAVGACTHKAAARDAARHLKRKLL